MTINFQNKKNDIRLVQRYDSIIINLTSYQGRWEGNKAVRGSQLGPGGGGLVCCYLSNTALQVLA